MNSDKTTSIALNRLHTDLNSCVKSVNGITPDASGNVTIETGNNNTYEFSLDEDGGLSCIKNGTDEGFSMSADGGLSIK